MLFTRTTLVVISKTMGLLFQIKAASDLKRAEDLKKITVVSCSLPPASACLFPTDLCKNCVKELLNLHLCFIHDTMLCFLAFIPRCIKRTGACVEGGTPFFSVELPCGAWSQNGLTLESKRTRIWVHRACALSFSISPAFDLPCSNRAQLSTVNNF